MIYIDLIIKVGKFLVIPKSVSWMFFENLHVNQVLVMGLAVTCD